MIFFIRQAKKTCWASAGILRDKTIEGKFLFTLIHGKHKFLYKSTQKFIKLWVQV